MKSYAVTNCIRKKTEAIAATELNARQETFFKISEATRRQLGAISGMLYISSQGPVGNGSISGEELAEVWKQFASGDSEVFSRMFLNMAANTEISMHELYYGTEIRRRHSENFLVGFDRLLILAKECDTDNIILDSLVYSAHGLLNNRMRELHPEIKFKLITGTNSEKYLERIINQNSDLAT
jgi:hypothetical protein